MREHACFRSKTGSQAIVYICPRPGMLSECSFSPTGKIRPIGFILIIFLFVFLPNQKVSRPTDKVCFIHPIFDGQNTTPICLAQAKEHGKKQTGSTDRCDIVSIVAKKVTLWDIVFFGKQRFANAKTDARQGVLYNGSYQPPNYIPV